jgi:hypothetical protein
MFGRARDALARWDRANQAAFDKARETGDWTGAPPGIRYPDPWWAVLVVVVGVPAVALGVLWVFPLMTVGLMAWTVLLSRAKRRNLPGGPRRREFDGADHYEVEFRWKEYVIYWEGRRGVVFDAAWGVGPLVTIVPDEASWDRKVPDWLHGRRDEVVARLRAKSEHLLKEERDDSVTVPPLKEITR